MDKKEFTVPETIDTALCFKALGDPVRLRIMELLGNGQMCACDLLGGIEVSQSTLSHHMKTLTESGLVTAKKDATWVYYRINREALQALTGILAALKEKSGRSRSGGRCVDAKQ